MAGNTSQAFDSLVEAMSGAVGGFVSASTLYPLDVVKTRMQAGQTGSYLDIVRLVARENGVIGLWKGFQYVGFSSAYEKLCYFYIYSFLLDQYQKRWGAIGPLTNLALGYCAEWSHKPITYPVDTITNIIKVDNLGVMAAIQLVSGDGLIAFYRGLSAHTIGALKPAVQYAVYEQIKQITLSKQTKKLSALQAFALGAAARATADIIMYPARTVKTRKQSAMKSTKAAQVLTPEQIEENQRIVSMSALACLLYIYKKDGVGAVYRGVEMEVGRGVLSAGLMLMIKERLASTVRRILLALLKILAP